MRQALISDLHGNMEAVRTVLRHIKKQGIKDILCLGDVVGYGPEPIECLDITMDCRMTLCGNHDEAVVKRAYGFNEVAERAVNWTREVLRPGWFSLFTKKRRWEFLTGLPLTHEEDGFLYVHASPLNPTMDYVFESDVEDCREGFSDKIPRILEKTPHVCFIGHTHTPGIITEDLEFISPEETNYRYKIKANKKYIVNVGSVGQPRDRDNRLCYATFDGEEIAWHRLGYDHRKTMDKVKEIQQLSPLSGIRLRYGE